MYPEPDSVIASGTSRRGSPYRPRISWLPSYTSPTRPRRPGWPGSARTPGWFVREIPVLRTKSSGVVDHRRSVKRPGRQDPQTGDRPPGRPGRATKGVYDRQCAIRKRGPRRLRLSEGRLAEIDVEERSGARGDGGEQAGGLGKQLLGVETGGADFVLQEDSV